jgi:hypothetical protein
MSTYRATNVFVPGGLPKLTYVPRSTRGLEARLRTAEDNLCKLVTITGATKSGKTVLTQQVFPRGKAVWLDGGSFDTEPDLWSAVLEQLDAFSETQESSGKSTSAELSGEAEGGVNALIAKGKAALGSKLGQTRQQEATHGRSVSPKTAASTALRQSGTPLIIDDFHYLDRPVQASVVRALKSLIFDGHPVILLAIPHRRYDAVRVEKEMTGRIESIVVPTWDREELLEIPQTGLNLLNVEAAEDVLSEFVDNALGSPHLMQDFCRHLCKVAGIEETASSRVTVAGELDRSKLFRNVAESTSRVVFDRLASGPRQRSDRIERPLIGGGTVDIYGAVLHAIARLKPGIQTLEYEEIRASLRHVLSDSIPQAHEVSRVLEHMAQISADDESSVPVIDFEKEERKLHITDPFFAFFLKWGLNGGR